MNDCVISTTSAESDWTFFCSQRQGTLAFPCPIVTYTTCCKNQIKRFQLDYIYIMNAADWQITKHRSKILPAKTWMLGAHKQISVTEVSD